MPGRLPTHGTGLARALACAALMLIVGAIPHRACAGKSLTITFAGSGGGSVAIADSTAPELEHDVYGDVQRGARQQ